MKIPKLPIILSAVCFVATCIAYRWLPETIAYHWDMNGQVNGFGSRKLILLIGAMPLVMVALMIFAAHYDPRQDSYQRHEATFHAVIMANTLLFIAVCALLIAINLGVKLKIELIVPLLGGALFVVIGNILPRCKPNFSLGIKTPWALSDENNWRRTHRVGGYGFVVVGLALIATHVLPIAAIVKWVISGTLVLGLVVGVYAYSWAIYQWDKPRDK
jgi:uncharacterized membrane protein